MVADITRSVPHSVWYGWGDPAHPSMLTPSSLEFMAAELNMPSIERAHPPVDFSEVKVSPSRLTEAQLAGLRGIVGDEYVATDDTARIIHAGGKSLPDLLRRRRGDADGAPDAVVLPGSNEEIREVLAFCVAEGIAVVPFGGGTSVVGGVEPERGHFEWVITLDLGRLNQLLSIDTRSRLATFQAGIRGPAIEAALAAHGYTLGHLPQSHEQATLGGYAATRSAGQSSIGYGRSNELITAVHIETPAGTLYLGGHAPSDAAGPHLLELIIGSEGVFGVITEVTVAIVPAPAEKAYATWSFPSFEAGEEALRAVMQEAARSDVPTISRLSDTHETDASFKLSSGRTMETLRRYLAKRGHERPALALFVWEGARGETTARKRRCAKLFRQHGGIYITASGARSWDTHRFSAPYRRDELLDRGVFVETLETATTWSQIQETHQAVFDAIHGALSANGGRGHVQTHISHAYRDGASLYYTFIAPMEGDGLEQHRRVKAAASEAIVASNATITHHHAVGMDHAPYLGAEIGDLGLAILASVKKTLDPAGIMNPGKLIQQRD